MCKESIFYRELSNIRRNYIEIDTSFGECCMHRCKHDARGSGKCAYCSEKDIAELVGRILASKIHSAIKLQHTLVAKALERIK